MPRVGCGDGGTASFAIDAVRKLTTSYSLSCKVGRAQRVLLGLQPLTTTAYSLRVLPDMVGVAHPTKAPYQGFFHQNFRSTMKSASSRKRSAVAPNSLKVSSASRCSRCAMSRAPWMPNRLT